MSLLKQRSNILIYPSSCTVLQGTQQGAQEEEADVTPHEVDSDEENPVQQQGTLNFGETAVNLWKKRSEKLKHDYAIAGWAFSVSLEICEQVIGKLGAIHREAIERVVRRLHVVPCPNKDPKIQGKDIEEIVDLFWDEFKTFVKKTKPFDNVARWNVSNAIKGESHLWHEKYTLPYTSVLGFVACRVTSKTLGIGPCERNWSAVKKIKTGKRVNLGGDSTEKRSVLYATALINDARIKKKAHEMLEATGANALFCDDDMK